MSEIKFCPFCGSVANRQPHGALCSCIRGMEVMPLDEWNTRPLEDRLLNIARGCHDYGGGYGIPREAEIFHHGIQTVINALESATEGRDFQTDVLESIGASLHQRITKR